MDDWKPFQQHSLPLWYAVSGGILEEVVREIDRGPDGSDKVEALAIQFLSTPRTPEEWCTQDYQLVGDGGDPVPPDSQFDDIPEKDAAKILEEILVKAGSLYAEQSTQDVDAETSTQHGCGALQSCQGATGHGTTRQASP